jgi:hypothetical protein
MHLLHCHWGLQLNNNFLVNVPACVFALTQLGALSVSVALFVPLSFANSFAAQLEPIVVFARCHRSADQFD